MAELVRILISKNMMTGHQGQSSQKREIDQSGENDERTECQRMLKS